MVAQTVEDLKDDCPANPGRSRRTGRHVSGLPPQHDHAGGGSAVPLSSQSAVSGGVGRVLLFSLWGQDTSTFGPTGQPARRPGRSPRHSRWTGYAPNWNRRAGRGGAGCSGGEFGCRVVTRPGSAAHELGRPAIAVVPAWPDLDTLGDQDATNALAAAAAQDAKIIQAGAVAVAPGQLLGIDRSLDRSPLMPLNHGLTAAWTRRCSGTDPRYGRRSGQSPGSRGASAS
jgi:hypothetical protein